jgi:serine/threonine protein kinase
VRRFLQEARAAAQLKHPNVVDVLDMGQDDDGTVFLVLELLEGETLKALLKRGALAPHEVALLLAPILRAVAAAHAKGVVHRDLKPDNIFLALGPPAPDGHRDTIPKLLDFGIAKVASEGDSGSTRTGAMVGTPQYMSPEQVRGDRELGPRADVWSMGVLLHYALTKRMPFNAESAPAVLARVLTERARPIREIAPALPAPLAAVIDRALQHEASARFADMREMALAFESAMGLSSAPREPSMVLGAVSPAVYAAVPSVPPPATSDIGATPTKILDPAPIPAASAPSEFPPSPTTPYAWGAPPAPAEEPRRDLRPLFAALAALLVLGGVASTWAVLEATGEEPTTASLPPISVPAARPTTTIAPAATIPADPQPAPIAPSVAEPSPEPLQAPASPAPASQAPASQAPASQAPASQVPPSPAPPSQAPAAQASAPSQGEAAEADPAPSRGEAPPRTRAPGEGPSRASRDDDAADPEAATPPVRTSPARGTGGALILRDESDARSREGAPRRGTGGALILR